MGPYNWQLFVLCGFGWFADKSVPTLPRLLAIWLRMISNFKRTVLTMIQ